MKLKESDQVLKEYLAREDDAERSIGKVLSRFGESKEEKKVRRLMEDVDALLKYAA